MPKVVKASPESVVTLRESAQKLLNDEKDLVDQRDVQRLMTDDKYAALFVQWSKKMEDSVKNVVKAFKWRHEKKVNDLTIDQLDPDLLKSGLMFLCGRSLEGNRVFYFRTSKADKKLKEQSMKLLIFWLERIQRKEPGQQVLFVLDNTDAGLKNSDMGFISFLIECLATYFPCMLDRMIIYNMPTLLNSIWKLVSKMLSQEQRDTTVMCSKDEIFKYIDAENVLAHAGGKNNFQYSYPPFPDDLV